MSTTTQNGRALIGRFDDMSSVGVSGLLRILVRRWHVENALVVADWCEEHGLLPAAEMLRSGPSANARTTCEALAFLFGGRTLSQMIHWERGWAPEVEGSCTCPDAGGRARGHSIPSRERARARCPLHGREGSR